MRRPSWSRSRYLLSSTAGRSETSSGSSGSMPVAMVSVTEPWLPPVMRGPPPARGKHAVASSVSQASWRSIAAAMTSWVILARWWRSVM